MKKTAALLFAFILAVTCSACGAKEAEGDTPISETPVIATDTTEELNASPQEDSLLTGIYRVPMPEIYIDVPNYQEIEQGYTELFIVHGTKYVAITAARRDTATDVENAHEKAFEKFKQNMRNHEGGVNSISITEDEIQTVNGLEVYSFEGTIHYGDMNKYDGYAIGYAFIMDGIPCEIIGSVVDESQSEELIEEIKTVVTHMIQTVRTEP